jgi:hypothetical protein
MARAAADDTSEEKRLGNSAEQSACLARECDCAKSTDLAECNLG